MKAKAFIIGMKNYNDIENRLTNPINDANAIEAAFNQLGINNTKVIDLGVATFRNVFDQFIEDLQNYEVAILFFAGHGLEIDGENFLCAVDTDFTAKNHVRYSALSLNYVIDQLQSTKVYTKIIILDACRDNPFIRGLRGIDTLTLAPVSAPLGFLIAFSTSPGQTASDGGFYGNGAYTHSLLKHILINDLKIEELFKRVRNTLYTLTNKKQISWEHTSLMNDFYFSTSQLIGVFDSNYSNFSLADATFNFAQPTDVSRIINALHSCNWNLQNPAIRQINRIQLTNADKDELFVLGRNIYQAGIGPAWGVQQYLDNIGVNMNYFSEEIRFHILNGIVFEIYFNSQGILRDEFKSEKIDLIYNLLNDDGYKSSLHFIDSKLRNYDFRVLYKPITRDNVILNIYCEQYNDTSYRITNINMNGLNILFNANGTALWQPDDNLVLSTKEELTEVIIKKIGVPSYQLSIFYIDLPDDTSKICIPPRFVLLNRLIHD
jgi:hypothetical protein